MPKISKAKKTANKKGSSKAARRAVLASKLNASSSEKDVKVAPKDFDESSEWEIEVILLFEFFLVSKVSFFINYF